MNGTDIAIIIIVCIVVILILLTLILGIRIVPQSNAFVIERLGKFHRTWESGIHIKMPIVDRIAKKISLKEQVVNFDPQTVITKDNVTMEIDTVLYFMVTDIKQFTYGVEKPIYAIENLTATTLRNAIGDIELDRTLTSRDQINAHLQAALDDATNNWGIKVIRVEVKNILPPIDVRNAMEKQMRAEREKRAVILEAEGAKQSKILHAEGEKEAMIKMAEGKSQALIVEQEALAKSIEILNNAKPSQEVLALRGFDTMRSVADGQATKIIIPSNLQGMVGEFATFAELLNSRQDVAAKKTSPTTKPKSSETIINDELLSVRPKR